MESVEERVRVETALLVMEAPLLMEMVLEVGAAASRLFTGEVQVAPLVALSVMPTVQVAPLVAAVVQLPPAVAMPEVASVDPDRVKACPPLLYQGLNEGDQEPQTGATVSIQLTGDGPQDVDKPAIS